jgi:hypothetical protein
MIRRHSPPAARPLAAGKAWAHHGKVRGAGRDYTPPLPLARRLGGVRCGLRAKKCELYA